MEFKHTPAPWKYTVRNANEIMTTFHGVTIGDVYLDITTSNQKSDAHLIAAAPELLSLLIKLDRIGGLGLSTHREIQSVIKKALGEIK